MSEPASATVFNFTIGATEYELRCDLNSITYRSSRDIARTETFCDVQKAPGAWDNGISGGGLWNGDATRIHAAMRAAKAAADPIAFEYGPNGDAAGLQRITGTMYLTSYEITARAGGFVEVTFDAEVVGDDTEDTWPA